MTSDRIRTFIHKPPVGGKRLQLICEAGLNSHIVVTSWTREQVDEADEAEGALVLEAEFAAQDYAEQAGEPCRFQFQWLNAKDLIMKSSVHGASPKDFAGKKQGDLIEGQPMSANKVITNLLEALNKKDMILEKSINSMLTGIEKVLKVQSETIDYLGKQRDAALAQAEVAGVSRTPEEIAAELRTHELKQIALEKLGSKVPDVIGIAVQLAAEHYLGKGGAAKLAPKLRSVETKE